MDRIIEKAKTDLASYKHKATELEGQIQKLQTFVTTYEELWSSFKFATETLEISGNLSPELEGKSTRIKIEVVAQEILLDGKKRSTVELQKELAARGVTAPSIGMISVCLSNAKGIFLSNRKEGWTLKKLNP